MDGLSERGLLEKVWRVLEHVAALLLLPLRGRLRALVRPLLVGERVVLLGRAGILCRSFGLCFWEWLLVRRERLLLLEQQLAVPIGGQSRLLRIRQLGALRFDNLFSRALGLLRGIAPNGPERLLFLALDLLLGRSVLALQLEMLLDRIVE